MLGNYLRAIRKTQYYTKILFNRTVRVSTSRTSTRTAAAKQKNVSDMAGRDAAVQLLPFVDYTLLQLCLCTTGTAGAAKCSRCAALPFCCARNAHVLRYMGWSYMMLSSKIFSEEATGPRF